MPEECEGLEEILEIARLRGGPWLCGDVEKIRGWLSSLARYKSLAEKVEPMYTPLDAGRVGRGDGYPQVDLRRLRPERVDGEGYVDLPWGGRP